MRMPSIYPLALKPSDCVAVIALSSPGPTDDLHQVAEKLADLNLTFEFLPSCYASHGHLAGPDSIRLQDLHSAFSNPKFSAILCMKGGAGSYRLLDQINYDIIRQNAKVFVGYSDVTAIHLAIQAKTGLVTFHGPMALSKWPEFTLKHFSQVTMKALKGSYIENPSQEAIEVLVPGQARGPLVGGNLSLLVNTLGSPYEVDTKGALFFIEDTLEPTYAIDRMLNALRLAGKFDDANGIILGTWSQCFQEEKNTYPGRDLDLAQIFQELIVPLGKPTLANVQFGHNTPQLTLPVGIKTSMSGFIDKEGRSEAKLMFLEDAVHFDVVGPNTQFPNTQALIEAMDGGARGLSLCISRLEAPGEPIFQWQPQICQHAASLIKVPIMLHVLQEATQGRIQLNERVLLRAEDQVGGCGSLQLMEAGGNYEILELMKLMICLSDNTATNLLIDHLGRENINQTLGNYDFACTQVARKLMVGDFSIYSTTNALEMVKCLALVAQGDFLSEPMRQLGLQILAQQQYNDRLSAHPTWQDYTFMHKTGEIEGVIHDAGLVAIGDQTYIIAALFKDLTSNYSGVGAIQDLGQCILKDLLDQGQIRT